MLTHLLVAAKLGRLTVKLVAPPSRRHGALFCHFIASQLHSVEVSPKVHNTHSVSPSDNNNKKMACITRLRAPLRTLTLTARATPALARANSTLAPGSSQDPSHPHLYYHPSPTGATTPTHMTLSFLPRPPAVASSKCVLGTLPALPDAGLNDFVENRAFRPLLHAALKDGLATAGVAETVEYEAQMRPGDGYMHVTGELRFGYDLRVG